MIEAHTYQLSTAENELGVAIAHSEEGKNSSYLIYVQNYYDLIYFNNCSNFIGVPMIPISWTQMQCPKSMSKEFRKVAKIVPEHAIEEQQSCK
jgi:exosome complex RNA-binding protein Csl4